MFACVYLSRSLRLSHQLAGGTGSPPCMQDPLSGPGWELGNTICFAEFFKRLKITNQMEFGNHPWLPIFSPLPASQLCHQWLGDDFSVTSQHNDFFSLLNSISAKATLFRATVEVHGFSRGLLAGFQSSSPYLGALLKLPSTFLAKHKSI